MQDRVTDTTRRWTVVVGALVVGLLRQLEKGFCLLLVDGQIVLVKHGLRLQGVDRA